jgi:hypothetical protein
MARLVPWVAVASMIGLLAFGIVLASRDAAKPNRRVSPTAETAAARIVAVNHVSLPGARMAWFDLDLRVDRPGRDPAVITGTGRLAIPPGALRSRPELQPVVGGTIGVFVDPQPPARIWIIEEPSSADGPAALPFLLLTAVAGIAFIMLLRGFGAAGPPGPAAPR